MRGKTNIWLTMGISLLVLTSAVSDLFGSRNNIENTPVTKRSELKNSLPNIFIMCLHRTKESNFGIFNEILSIIKDVTWNKTVRYHDKKSYDEIFIDGIHNKKPSDIIVLLFSLETKDRIPLGYEDLLLWEWRNIEGHLK